MTIDSPLTLWWGTVSLLYFLYTEPVFPSAAVGFSSAAIICITYPIISWLKSLSESTVIIVSGDVNPWDNMEAQEKRQNKYEKLEKA